MFIGSADGSNNRCNSNNNNDNTTCCAHERQAHPFTCELSECLSWAVLQHGLWFGLSGKRQKKNKRKNNNCQFQVNCLFTLLIVNREIAGQSHERLHGTLSHENMTTQALGEFICIPRTSTDRSNWVNAGIFLNSPWVNCVFPFGWQATTGNYMTPKYATCWQALRCSLSDPHSDSDLRW